MWDKNMIENIKMWVEKYVYDTNEILFKKMEYPNNILTEFQTYK